MKIVTFIKAVFGYPPEKTEAQVVQESLKAASLALLAAKAEQESIGAAVSSLTARKARLEAEHRRLQGQQP